MNVKQLIGTILLLFVIVELNAQELTHNSISVHIGMGQIDGDIPGSSFELNYSRHMFSGLYGVVTYTKYSGSRSVSDVIEGEITGGERNELGDHIFINTIIGGSGGGNGEFDIEGTAGSLISIRSFAVGVRKFIKMGERLRLGGSLFTSFSKVSHQYIDGISYDESDKLISENIFPTYEIYNTIGGKAELELSYFITDYLSLGTSASYNSSPQIVMLRLGVNTWF